jgi:8-oxo-dGTP pyrophosphatase MutT (NUDIX family)
MASHDGNGWVECGLGHRHWGRYGAAGLLAYVAGDPDPAHASVLLQRRSWWAHHGGTWGLPGGARDSHETATDAALREAAEESAVPPDAVRVEAIYLDDHIGWSYQTVIALADAEFEVYPASDEAIDVAWVPVTGIGELELHPGLAARWELLVGALQPLTLIVDGANVMGSRPDGWWRDRAGAARRLRVELGKLAEAGLAELPESTGGPALTRWLPDIVLVLEGAARPAGLDGPPDQSRLSVVAAPGSGDDAIAELAARTVGRRVVVTADRELRRRCVAAGASVAGPGWLLDQLRH